MYLIEHTKSSLISEIEYWEDEELLYIRFAPNYYVSQLCYEGVNMDYFIAFSEAKSLGKFYLKLIKPFFKIKTATMAKATSKKAEPEVVSKKERPKTQNQSSDEVRWIDISINVRNIISEWIYAGEKGDYLHLSMRMQPDGEVDAYGNLGMITQKVPKEIYEKEVNLPKDKKTKGPILGNACEFVKAGHEQREGDPGAEVGQLGGVAKDDLPF